MSLIVYHGEPEGWWAESPQAPSFFAAGKTRDEVQGLARSHFPVPALCEVEVWGVTTTWKFGGVG